MSDQYDVEEGILDCWHITDDLKTLTEGVLDGNLNADEIANALIGLQTLYQLKFDKLFQAHSSTFPGNDSAEYGCDCMHNQFNLY